FRLRKIHNICLSHQKLVDKLLSSKLNPLQSNEVKFQCDRYFTLLHRSASHDFPEGQVVSTNLLDIPSSLMLSQISLGSLSTSGTDEDENHCIEIMSYEGTSSASALEQRVLQATETSEIRLLLSDIDSELNILANSLSGLSADYARSLKPLNSAQADLEKLRDLNKKRCQLDGACDSLSRKVSGDDFAIVRSLALHLHSLEEPFTTFLRELQTEVDDEIALQANYEGIAKKLNELNIDIDQRARNSIQDVRKQLEHVQSDLNLLRTQCSHQRKYVENMLECVPSSATPTSNCSRRKKIMLMVSTTVTTIIQVVEDELRRSPSIKENDLLELKQKLQDVNTCIVDETDTLDHGILYIPTDKKELQKSEHENVVQSELAQLGKEESEKGRTKKNKKALTDIDEQINAFESALNETFDEILPPMNELISRSHQESINLPSLQSELENTQNFAEKCKVNLLP
ncbi:unnamed protein product, partial [Brugia pahangi]|uniref:Dynactin subunit 2 n=1 Tax=Brugia pahangi TaxID=6280 RepID=A0A0N4T7D6_BRUPA